MPASISAMKIANCKVELANWPDDKDDLKAIRTVVFIEEQCVPIELEWDGLDEQCIHFIARIASMSVATARLKADGQLGRMAVLKDYRQLGIGSILLTTALTYAKDTDFKRIYLHAQTQVIGFYEKFGFTVKGKEFMDAGIPHREMSFKI